MMKNKKLSLFAFLSLTAVAAAGAVSSAISWFTLQTRISNGDLILGSSFGGYFGGGDGSSEAPYKIYNRTHMYNLAWLQYLGMFNSTTNNRLDKQFYFILMDDIDMGGMAIPPIGTEEYPFLGNFDGDEHVIHNFTVANYIGTNGIQRKPTSVSASDLDNVKIVGLFGVVGQINDTITYSSQTNSIHDFALDNFTIRTTSSQSLVGLAAGYVGATIDSVAIGESNFNISSGTSAISVTNGGNTTYPYGNVLSNYGVVGYCEPDKLAASKIVDIKADQPQFFEVGSGDTGDNWGASIPMEDIYNTIDTYRDQSTRVQYKSAEHYYYDENHNEITSYYTSEESDVPTQNTGVYYQFRDTQLKNSSGQQYASYSLGYRVQSTTSNAVYLEQYTYLYGEKTGTISGGTTRHNHEYENKTAYTIDDGSGHYLSQNSNSLNAVTSTDSTGATKWAVDGNYLYTQIVNNATQNEYYLTYNGQLRLTTTPTTQWTFDHNVYYCTYNNQKYFLRYNNGWTTTTTAPWSSTGTGKYYIHNGSNYLSANGTTGVSNQTSEENATAWSSTNGLNDNAYFYITSGGNNYYIGNSSNRGSLRINTSTSYRYAKSGNYLYASGCNTNYRYVRLNGTTWTVSGSGSRTTLTFTEQQEYNYSSQAYSINRTSTTAKIRVDNTSTINGTYQTKPTYIPLKYELNDGGNPIDVSIENTGYIVSGANYDNVSAEGTAGDIRVSYYGLGSRVGTNGPYPLQNSFSNGTSYVNTYSKNNAKYFEVLTRTANSDGYKRIKDSYNTAVADSATFPTNIRNISRVAEADFEFEKYSAARTAFHKSFVGENETGSSSNAYGLHFMDASINVNNKISVERVAVQGATYQYNSTDNYTLKTWKENKLDANGMIVYDDQNQPIKIDKSAYVDGKYELLEDCIDFKLNKNGTINFFAGTYFTNNNSFFSLNHVFRNTATTTRTINGESVTVSKENEISAVKQINEIWTNTDYNVNDNNPKPRYLYKYSDGKWLQNDGTVSNSTTTPDNAGEKVFDLGWVMGSNTTTADFSIVQNACYYFEIPVVTGEYALGAVSGKLGAYLMYLDIGASDITNEKMRVKEKIVTRTEYYQYPKGISFAEIVTTNNDPVYVAVTGDEAGTVIVPTSVSGNISFELDDDKLKCGPPDGGGSLSQTTYHNENISVVTGANYTTELTLVASSWKNVSKEKVSTYAYDAANQKMYVTYTSDILTTTNTDAQGVESHDNKAEDLEGYTLSEADYAASKFVAYIPSDTDIYVEYTYQAPYEENNGQEVENVTITYEVKYDVSTGVYTYEFTITTTVNIKVKIVDLKSRVISNTETYKFSINGTEYAEGSTVSISAS